MPATRSELLRLALLAGVVALVQMRLVILIFGPQYRLSVEAAQGVLRGEPHWRVYQSRLLGPWLVEAVSRLVGSFITAHVVCMVVLFAAAGFVVLWQLRRDHGASAPMLAGYLAFVVLVVCCFQRPWLYVWDCIDLLLFALFSAFVCRGLRWPAFAALYSVAIVNREGALFIALWLILDPLVRWLLDRRKTRSARLDHAPLLAGIVLLAAGVALVEWLRDRLLVREVGPELVGEVAGAGPRYHLMLADNLARLGEAVTSPSYAMSFLVPFALLAFVVFSVAVARRDPYTRGAAAVVHLALVAAIVVFGSLFETRIYLVLVPFAVLHARWGGSPRRAASNGYSSNPGKK